MKKKINVILILCLVCFTMNACINAKKLSYFNNIGRDSTSIIAPDIIESKINVNDILKITITSLDEEATRMLNAGSAISGSNANVEGYSGLLVNAQGSIKLPIIGEVKASGQTKEQLEKYIANKLIQRKIVLDPIVTVRIVNYKITVLGEVTKPGVIPVPNERITIPEAIGMAGDLTPYGKRENVLLIREEDGKRIYKRFSLNDDQLFNKSYYNLQNQDILYVEPTNARAALSDRTTQLTPIVLSALSLLVIIYSYAIRRN